MIFQQVIANHRDDVQPLEPAIQSADPCDVLDKAWTYILEEVDYVPIFTLAREVLRALKGTPNVDVALKEMAQAAQRITARRAALRHDLMGRVYHRLLSDRTRKHFGAFYTTIPAATLLLRLALPPDSGIDWANLEDVGALRIADLACGTGTLLKAAVQTVADNHVRARADAFTEPDLDGIHKALVEQSIWGFDALPFAIHLAAAALTLQDPNVAFGNMNFHTFMVGFDPKPRLGSLDLLSGIGAQETQSNLFGAATGPTQITGAGEIVKAVEPPKLDLCVMNPPFTRSVGGNLLFGDLPKKQRVKLQARLKATILESGIKASITPGLGPAFIALGHKFVKEGGRLALVIPKSLLTGVEWEDTRLLIGNSYHLEYIIVSHEPKGWFFSESTKLSECMVVARRLTSGEAAGPTTVINLSKKPISSLEALVLVHAIRNSQPAQLDAPTGTSELSVDGHKFGEMLQAPAERIRKADWSPEIQFALTDLARVAFGIRQSRLTLPGGHSYPLPLAPLGSFARVGPDRRDIHDGFTIAKSETAYPAFWDHRTDVVRTVAQQPNSFLAPRTKAAKGRNLRDAGLLSSRAGSLLVAERIRFNTVRTVAISTSLPVLSNTWWPVRIYTDDQHDIDAERIMAMWFNSTLGIVSLMAARGDTEGAFVQIKKPILETLPALNPNALTGEQRNALLAGFKSLGLQELQPAMNLTIDPVRHAIDALLMTALAIPGDLSSLRSLVAAEPMFPKPGQDEDADLEPADEDDESPTWI